MNTDIAECSAVEIWERTIEPQKGDLPPAEARAMLRLKLSQPDLDRADVLAAKARAGQLTPREERELDNYVATSSALEFLKSKARRSLQQAAEPA
jgi:hypothetical protein